MRRGRKRRPVGFLCVAFGIGVILATVCFPQLMVVLMAFALTVMGIALCLS